VAALSKRHAKYQRIEVMIHEVDYAMMSLADGFHLPACLMLFS
jgi:hypothetical protein